MIFGDCNTRDVVRMTNVRGQTQNVFDTVFIVKSEKLMNLCTFCLSNHHFTSVLVLFWFNSLNCCSFGNRSDIFETAQLQLMWRFEDR